MGCKRHFNKWNFNLLKYSSSNGSINKTFNVSMSILLLISKSRHLYNLLNGDSTQMTPNKFNLFAADQRDKSIAAI